jgi:WD40 repeat protein
MLAQWNLEQNSLIKKTNLNRFLNCCSVSPSNCSLAIGSQCGLLEILCPSTFSLLFSIPTRLPISLLKYSPDGRYLSAVLAPPSNFVNLYDV